MEVIKFLIFVIRFCLQKDGLLQLLHELPLGKFSAYYLGMLLSSVMSIH